MTSDFFSIFICWEDDEDCVTSLPLVTSSVVNEEGLISWAHYYIELAEAYWKKSISIMKLHLLGLECMQEKYIYRERNILQSHEKTQSFDGVGVDNLRRNLHNI